MKLIKMLFTLKFWRMFFDYLKSDFDLNISVISFIITILPPILTNKILNLDDLWGLDVSCFLAVLVLIYTVVYLVSKLIKFCSIIKSGKRTFKLLHNYDDVTLLNNSFEKNADYLLKHFSAKELEKCVMAMGMDETGDMKINTIHGIAHYMLSYLNENYEVNGEKPEDVVQKTINEVKGDKEIMDFGTCIDVQLQLTPIGQPNEQPKMCNLLLVVNSAKENGKRESLIDKGLSNNIIPAIFDHIEDSNCYESLLIGVLGTNGLGLSYSVILSQIINQFARISRNPKLHFKRLYLSIRKDDYYNRWNISLPQIEHFILECSRFYSKTKA